MTLVWVQTPLGLTHSFTASERTRRPPFAVDHVRKSTPPDYDVTRCPIPVFFSLYAGDSEKFRKLEETINGLAKDLRNIQTSVRDLNQKLYANVLYPSISHSACASAKESNVHSCRVQFGTKRSDCTSGFSPTAHEGNDQQHPHKAGPSV